MDQRFWDERYAGADLVWTAEANRFVVDEVADLPPGRAVDLAAGECRNAVWLAERGWEVDAVDFSAVGLAKGERLAEHRGVAARVHPVVADLLTWSAPGRYDLVLVAYLHLPAPARATVFGAAAAAVARGGTLLVVGHDLANLTEGHGGPQDPAVLTTAADLVAHLGDLTVLRAGPVERRVETPDGPRTAIDHLLRATRTA
ncbi:MAG: SAM-dependent methyltransferase [Actinomycetes bacterium]